MAVSFKSVFSSPIWHRFRCRVYTDGRNMVIDLRVGERRSPSQLILITAVANPSDVTGCCSSCWEARNLCSAWARGPSGGCATPVVAPSSDVPNLGQISQDRLDGFRVGAAY